MADSPSTGSALHDPIDVAMQVDQMERFEAPVRHSAVHAAISSYANVDPFADINACTPEQIERLARILEIRGAQPRQSKMRAACFTAAGIGPGTRVLELGCGTGVVTRELARIVGSHGRVVGVDVCPDLLRVARAGSDAVEYVEGDAYQLPFAADAFDASCAITLLAHLDDLDGVIAEMIRVTRGTVMVLDQDYQTLVFENSDTRLTRTILQHGADYNVRDGWCGRKLPGLLVRHRLRDVQCWPFVYSERDSQLYLITIAERFAALAASRGAVSDAAAKAWLQELYERAHDGTFYASLNYYCSFGRTDAEVAW